MREGLAGLNNAVVRSTDPGGMKLLAASQNLGFLMSLYLEGAGALAAPRNLRKPDPLPGYRRYSCARISLP